MGRERSEDRRRKTGEMLCLCLLFFSGERRASMLFYSGGGRSRTQLYCLQLNEEHDVDSNNNMGK